VWDFTDNTLQQCRQAVSAFVLINTFLEYFFKDIIQPSAGGFDVFGQSWHIDGAESAMAVYSVIQQSTCMVFVVRPPSANLFNHREFSVTDIPIFQTSIL
jgi:hypothetical protein